jgi:hypothetical protein
MEVKHLVVGAAVGAVLLGILPATAGADGRLDSRFSSAPEQNARSSAVRDPGQVFDPLNVRSRPAVGSSSLTRQEAGHLRMATQLRKLIGVVVQNNACHPRGKPPHGQFGYTSIGYLQGFDFDDDRGKHDGHGHHGHGPPFCPSPH